MWQLGIVDTSFIIIYLILIIFIGYSSGKGVKNIEEYSVGKGRFNTLQIIATIFATWVGGGVLIGSTAEIYKSGIVSLATVGFIGQWIIMSELLVKRFIQFSNAISFGDIMEVFYGKIGKVISGFLGMFTSVGMIGSQILAITVILMSILNITKLEAAILSYGIVVFYATFGGIRSVVITDFIQSILIVVTFIILVIFLLVKIGGVNQLISSIPSWSISFAINTNTFQYICMFIIYLLPAPQPVTVQRILMNKNLYQTILSFRYTIVAFILVNICVIAIGLSSIVILPNIEANMIIPIIIKELLPIGFKGLVIVGILAIMMSTADSFLNVASISFTHDFLTPLFKIRKNKELLVTKFVSLFLGIVAIFIALYADNIINIMLKSHGFWLSSVAISFIFALYGIKVSIGKLLIFFTLSFILLIATQFFLSLKAFGILISTVISTFIFIIMYLLEIRKNVYR